jgi:hypothetical protein
MAGSDLEIEWFPHYFIDRFNNLNKSKWRNIRAVLLFIHEIIFWMTSGQLFRDFVSGQSRSGYRRFTGYLFESQRKILKSRQVSHARSFFAWNIAKRPLWVPVSYTEKGMRTFIWSLNVNSSHVRGRSDDLASLQHAKSDLMISQALKFDGKCRCLTRCSGDQIRADRSSQDSLRYALKRDRPDRKITPIKPFDVNFYYGLSRFLTPQRLCEQFDRREITSWPACVNHLTDFVDWLSRMHVSKFARDRTCDMISIDVEARKWPFLKRNLPPRRTQ